MTVERRVAVYPTLGIAFLSFDGGDETDVAKLERAIDGARAVVERAGGNLVVVARPPDSTIDPFGTLPASFRLMRELKRRFDPHGRMNPGMFVGRL